MAVAFDWGHPVMDERRDGDAPLHARSFRPSIASPTYTIPTLQELPSLLRQLR